MKKLYFLLSFLFLSLTSIAENAFSVDEIDIKMGEEQTLSVSLTNEQDAKSVAIDITLPEGLSFVDEGSVVFSSRADGIMSKSAKIQTSGALRVGLAFGSVPAGTGELFTFKVKAVESAAVGTVKIQYTNMSLTYSGKVTIPNMESNVTIYNTFIVTANTADEVKGTVSGGGEYRNGVNATLTATPNEGYDFTKWSNDVTDNPYSFEVNVATTLTAEFTAINYTIGYDLASGALAEDVTNPSSYTIESNAITLAEPSREGYTFTGWTYEGQTTPVKPVTIAKGSTGNKSYTANWTAITYTIEYTMGGGTNAGSNPTSYTIESNAITLAEPSRDGYTFAGWTYEGQTTPVKSVTIAKGSTGNKSFTAQWTPIEIALDEDATEIFASTGDAARVTVKRTITANAWNTICLPFTMTEAVAEDVFGSDVEIAEFSGFETTYSSLNPKVPTSITLNFSTIDEKELTAGKPFLIKTSKSIESFAVNDVSISNLLTPTEVADGNGTPGSFVGTFVNTKVPANALFVNGGKLWYSKGESGVKAFRGWFELGSVLGQETDFNARFSICVDGETTNIADIERRDNAGDETIYNLSGQRISTPGKGLYIINGKKIIKK